MGSHDHQVMLGRLLDNALRRIAIGNPALRCLAEFYRQCRDGLDARANAGRKRVVLELGDNAGVIVELDADLDLAAQRCVGFHMPDSCAAEREKLPWLISGSLER